MSRLRLALLLALLPSAYAAEPGLTFTGPHSAGTLAAPPRNETSGLAASRRHTDILWLHDDSGAPAELYAVGTDGTLRATLKIDGVKNTDWEEVTAVELDAKSWLVIGDIGDNDAKRKRVSLHFVEEPALPLDRRAAAVLTAKPAATLRLTFADGARDCEAFAIDPRERAIYLLTKRDATPRLYRAEIPAAPLSKSTDIVAAFVVEVPQLARITAGDGFILGLLAKGRARPCGMDFAADGTVAAVVTYTNVAVFPRATGETWAEAFARQPSHLAAHALPQAEAICFSRDSRAIYVASEETRDLLRYDRR